MSSISQEPVSPLPAQEYGWLMQKPPREGDSAAVELVDYDEEWPNRFESECAMLTGLLSSWLVGTIEHVGSTAIVGMRAKPVIDMMAPVADLESARDALAILAAHGYHYAPYRAEVMHWLCKPSPSFRTHHLHLVPFGSALWRQRLAFRDCLRHDAALAARYLALKTELATLHPNDREAYTRGKSAFIRNLLESLNT